MAVPPPEEIEFHEDDPAAVEAELEALAAAHRGWINLLPEVESGHEPPPRRFTVAIFSARGDPVPMATWSAADGPGRRATVGIEHGSGPKALALLAANDLPLPAGWLRVADHPRRGLVLTVPADAAAADVLWWLLAATHVLSVPPLTGSWSARVYRP